MGEVENVLTKEKPRIAWVDAAKGFTILLVIIGHGSLGNTVNSLIYSFHMPLFFIVSCYTFRFSTDDAAFVKKTEKAFMHLVVPAFFIFFGKMAITILKSFSKYAQYSAHMWRVYLAKKISAFVFASGTAVAVGSEKVRPVGACWFLIVLFLGRTLFDYLHLKLPKKWLYIAVGVLSVVGVCFGRVQWLPFSLDIALAIQPLFLFVLWFKNFDLKKHLLPTFALSLEIWLVLLWAIRAFSGRYPELAVRRYSLFPICYICAIAGTLFMCSFCVLFVQCKRLSKPIVYLGKHSMEMFLVHCFDNFFSPLYRLTSHPWINMALRLAVDLAVFALIVAVLKVVNKISEKRRSNGALPTL